MSRLSVDVVNKLLAAKKELVKDYDTLVPTPDAIADLVDGTSFFPGGTGIWRGEAAHAPMPKTFPDAPYMFVGNYWFNEDGFKQAKCRGVEDVSRATGFWASLRAYLKAANLTENECFFTNALMGLTPDKGPTQGRPTGHGPSFRAECRAYFDEQVRIVQPCRVIVMGDHAKELLLDYVPRIDVPHPSSLRAKPSELVAAAKKKIRILIATLDAARQPI